MNTIITIEPTLSMFLIVCPFLFLAGLVDAIGGGGGLISLPAYLIAGLPTHTAIATNKLSSTCGTTLATARFIKNGLVNFKLAVPSVIMAIIGSAIGAHISLIIPEKIMMHVLIVVLPIAAFFVLNKKLFHDNENDVITLDKRTYLTASIAAFVIGMYDGFYGPGTGTFLLLVFTKLGKLNMEKATGNVKVVNLSSNISALVTFILAGKILLGLGLAASCFSIAGHYVGAGMVVNNGVKIIKPIILVVLVLLLIKVVMGL